MNKTFNVNIAGQVFHINDDAYQNLEQYLDNIKRHFETETGGQEIVADIESRMAEIFTERFAGRRSIIEFADVEAAVVILGKVNDMESNGVEENGNPTSNETQDTEEKKLFRDIDDKYFGGVSTGLSHYFGLDANIIRIIFVILAFSTAGILIYLILWAAIPGAKTNLEKMQMKGEPITLSNLEKNITKQINEVADGFKKKNIGITISSLISRIIKGIVTILNGIWKIVSKIFGIFSILIGIILLAIMVNIWFFDAQAMVHINDSELEFVAIKPFVTHFFQPNSSTLFILTTLGLALIPIISMLSVGVKILLNIKKSFKAFYLSLGMAWFFLAIMLAFYMIPFAKEFKHERVVKQVIHDSLEHSKIYVQFNDNKANLTNPHWILSLSDDALYMNESSTWMHPEMEILESEDSLWHFELVNESKGRSVKDALKRAESIQNSMVFRSDTLFVNEFTVFPNPYRGQMSRLKIYKPFSSEIQSNRPELIIEALEDCNNDVEMDF
jgi:phage shock protein PspC (stress-responsive transcriptional regulator)